MSFFTELQRRNVVRVGIAYIVVSWIVAQVAEFAFESFGAPDWTIKSLVVLLLLGLPVVLIFSWAYEMTPEGLKREKDVVREASITSHTGRRINHIIIAALVLALVFFAGDKYLWQTQPEVIVTPEPAAQTEEQATLENGAPDNSVAVLPFLAMSDGPDDEFFADGLTEEILNSLAQLPELLVTARTSAFFFKGPDIPPIPEIAAKLGVKHVVEGSVRRSGDRLRVTAQLIRANDGFHLWSNNYDSTQADTIQVQENIAEKIAVALDVVLDEKKSTAMRKAGLRDVEAFTMYQKGIELFRQAHGEIEIVAGLRAANEYFDRVIELAPEHPDAYVYRADLYTHMLNDDAIGARDGRFTAADAAAALPANIESLQAAVRYTQNRADRVQAELDLSFVQGNWRGLVARTERALAADVCGESNWMTTIANSIGLSAQHVDQSKRVLACDPLRSLSWFNLARATLWTGDAQEAIRIAREGIDAAPGSWLYWVYVRALIEDGRYDEARDTIDTQLTDPIWSQAARVLLAARQGDTERYAQAMAGFDVDIDRTFFGLMLHAWGGDRASANRLAAEYDTHPWGPWALWQDAHWCACGNAFDLDVTPNFARMLREAEIPWPPESGREFPLKGWY